MDAVEIREIPREKKAIKKFIKFAFDVYKDSKHWVAPIISDQLHFMLDGPFYDIGEVKFFMAFRGNKPVARLTVHRNFAHNEHYNTNQGFFGFFEAFDDSEAVNKLFETGLAWLKEKGCSSVHGPMNFAIYDEIGMLMDAYDLDPVLMCPYNTSYYPSLMEKAGFRKEVDWYAFLKDGHEPLPEIMQKVCKRIDRQPNVVIRKVNKKKWAEEVGSVRHIFDLAWSENWGNVPFTDAQWEHIVKELKLVIKEDLAFICEVDGVPVGFSISLPDANAGLKLARGKLFPFGILKILWGVSRVKRVRTMIMGVLKEYRRRGFDMYLIKNTIENGLKNGYNDSDCSLIVETNSRMLMGLEAIGARKYKTYRIFTRDF